MNRHIARLLLATAPALMLSACTVGPDYARPTTPEPESWATPPEGGVTTAAPDPEALRQWWTTLGDTRLDALVTAAIAGNLDLKAARARIIEARALRGIVEADGLPQIDARAGYTRERTSENTAFGGGGGGGPGAANTETDFFQAGFDANWELDIFGRVRRGVQAADADIDAAVATRDDVLVSLLAEVARNYVELRAFQRRAAIAESNIRVQQETVTLSAARFKAGLSSELDLQRAESLLATTRASLPSFAAGMRAAAHRLAVLTGQTPGALVADLSAVAPIPGIPGEVRVGVPADVLRRRPDVRAAERRVAAASARVGVATADLYPRLTLNGTLGLEAANIGDLVDANSRAFTIGPSLRWAILSGGRIRANIAAADARLDGAAAQYESAVLVALEDAETALVNYAREQDRRASLSRAVDAGQRAVDLANELFSRGLTDFFNVLDTQRQLFALQDQLAQSERDVTGNLIAVYKSIGGGWNAGVQAAVAEPAKSLAE